MMIKKITWAVALSCLTTFAYADDDDPMKVKSEIETVTVYKQNAKIIRTATSNIPSGNSEIVLEQLSSNMLTNSVQVKISNSSVELIAAVPRLNYIEQSEANKRYQEVEDSILLLTRELDVLNIEVTALQARRSVLMNNNLLEVPKNRVLI